MIISVFRKQKINDLSAFFFKSGWTPLMISSSAGSLELVKFYLEHGCDPNSQNENKQRALHYAASKNFPQVGYKKSPTDLIN